MRLTPSDYSHRVLVKQEPESSHAGNAGYTQGQRTSRWKPGPGKRTVQELSDEELENYIKTLKKKVEFAEQEMRQRIEFQLAEANQAVKDAEEAVETAQAALDAKSALADELKDVLDKFEPEE